MRKRHGADTTTITTNATRKRGVQLTEFLAFRTPLQCIFCDAEMTSDSVDQPEMYWNQLSICAREPKSNQNKQQEMLRQGTGEEPDGSPRRNNIATRFKRTRFAVQVVELVCIVSHQKRANANPSLEASKRNHSGILCIHPATKKQSTFGSLCA